jgi:Fe-S cluster biogenesis protein NfuA
VAPNYPWEEGGGACPGCSSSIAGILSGSADIQLVVEDAVIMDLTHYNNKD